VSTSFFVLRMKSVSVVKHWELTCYFVKKIEQHEGQLQEEETTVTEDEYGGKT
jgi:hypothetical protein